MLSYLSALRDCIVIKSIFRRSAVFLISFGFDPRRFLASLFGLPTYIYQLASIVFTLRSQGRGDVVRIFPQLSDRWMSSGVARGHYFHQDLWAARLIYEANPVRHVDVGSRIDGFVAHLLCFRSVEVIDIRPLASNVTGLTFRQADMMSSPPELVSSTDSLSCLHALEHFGLGRYGDPLNVDGWRKGLACLAQMLSDGGKLYLSVPVGKECIEFNAQHIFDPKSIIQEAVACGLSLEEFSFIDDAGEFHRFGDVSLAAEMDFGCGCFVLRKSCTQ